jgi:hypothetical protein
MTPRNIGNTEESEICTDPAKCCEDPVCYGDPDQGTTCFCQDLWDCSKNPAKCEQSKQVPGSGNWECTWTEDVYTCTKTGQEAKPPQGGAGFDCQWDEETDSWVCEQDIPPNPYGSPDGTNSWDCTVNNDTNVIECTRVSDPGSGVPPAFSQPPTGHGQPAPPVSGECVVWGDVTYQGSEELVVVMPDELEDQGILHAEAAGWYDLFNDYLAESGDNQTNESCYFRVVNDTNPAGHPVQSNCGKDWVIMDRDNDGTPTTSAFIGTFWLDKGDNTLQMHHYCPRFKAGECVDLHNDLPENKTCPSTNPNSVHFRGGTSLCVVPVE